MSVRTSLRGADLPAIIQSMISKAPEAGKRGLRRAAKYGFDDSQQLVHVVTGELKSSGYIKDTPDGAEYGYRAGHAYIEENGNSRRPAHPYVAPAQRQLESGLAADYVYEEIKNSI